MLNETFLFKNRRADSMGVKLQAPVKISAAVPKVTALSIPGKNGDLHYFDGSFENREIKANCFILSERLNSDFSDVNSWLMGENGYFRFSLSEDENHYFFARAVNGVEYNPRGGILNPFSLTFDAKPQRFLSVGERELEFDVTGNMEIYNPTGFAALPIVKVAGTGNIELTFTNESKETTLSVTGLDGKIVFDSETRSAYNGGVFMNNYVLSDSCPILYPGKTEIEAVGNISTLKIIPRWWEL